MKNIVIIGAGDLGKEVVWLIEDINKRNPSYLILGFLDNDPEKIGKEFYGYKVLGNDETLEHIAIVGIKSACNSGPFFKTQDFMAVGCLRKGKSGAQLCSSGRT